MICLTINLWYKTTVHCIVSYLLKKISLYIAIIKDRMNKVYKFMFFFLSSFVYIMCEGLKFSEL